MRRSAKLPAFALAGLLVPVACAELLLDNGSIIGGGRTVSGNWTIFQPFTVPEPGWHVTSVGADGFYSNDPAGSGMLASILKDDGTGHPDELQPAAENVIYMAYFTSPASSQWRYANFDIELLPGQYYMRWADNNQLAYFGTLWRAPMGEPSFSRREDNGQIFPSDPTALRIEGTVLGAPCVGDLNGDGVVDLGDLATLLANFGSGTLPEHGDLDGDGDVDLADLSLMLAVFGVTCG